MFLTHEETNQNRVLYEPCIDSRTILTTDVGNRSTGSDEHDCTAGPGSCECEKRVEQAADERLQEIEEGYVRKAAGE